MRPNDLCLNMPHDHNICCVAACPRFRVKGAPFAACQAARWLRKTPFSPPECRGISAGTFISFSHERYQQNSKE